MDMVEWLYSLQHFGIKLGLHNISALLRLLDHPERSYPCVLIAGTNGKGSVAAMLHEILNASGLTAGMFTSPHLVRPTVVR
jgi:dihydrofolate synthase/folylpolyglutamate synthase